MEVFEVWAQADVFEVRMTLIPSGQAGVLETLILKAIQAEADTAEDLSDTFGLAPRLLEGVLGDLWRAGRISIDLSGDDERIRLTSQGRHDLEALSEDGSVASTDARAATEELALDRLTGRVLPFSSTFRFARERGLVVPTMADDPQVASLREADLLEALSTAVRRRHHGDVDRVGDWRVATAYLAPALLRTTMRRRFVPIRVAAAKDEAGGLTARVIDEGLSLHARMAASRRLQGVIAEQPTGRFAAQVGGQAKRTPLQVRTVGQLVSELQHAVDALYDCPPANRQREHDRAADKAGQVDRYTKALALTEMEAQPVRTADEHRTVVNSMLDEARVQVVLAVPWLRPRGIERIRDSLLTAVQRGVQVTVLWGITAGDERLHDGVLAAFEEVQRNAIRARRGGALRFHRTRGAKNHAKLVVSDDRQLLVTSKNFLSGSASTELGLRLRAVGDLASPVIEQVLHFLYEHTPDPATAFQLVRTRDSFGARIDVPPGPELLLPRFTASLSHPDVPDSQVRAWAADWHEAASVLAGRAARPRPTVEVIRDGQHTALVREALATAERRVLITSDKVTAHALTAEVGSLIKARAGAGIQVAVRYARVADTESQERIDQLTGSRRAGEPDVVHQNNMHAKVIVCDDSCVIGSFNHLSVEAGTRSRRATGELSVRVTSAAVADGVMDVILGSAVAPTAGGDPAPLGGVQPAPQRRMAQRVLDVLEPEAGLPDVDALVAFVRAEGSDAVLATVRHLGLGAGAEQRVHAATALALLPVPGPARDGELEQLLRSVWAEGSWAFADLLRQALDDPNLAPRPVLTSTLATRVERATALSALATDATPATAAETTVLRVATCVSLLLNEPDDPSLVNILGAWPAGVGGPIDAFVAHATAYCNRYGPLPEDLPGTLAAQAERATLDASWEDVGARTETLRRYRPNSLAGEAVHALLFAPGGEMAALEHIVDGRAATALLAWKDEHSEANDSGWLNRVTKEAGHKTIDNNRRQSFINKRRELRLAVHRLAAVLNEQSQAPRQELPREQISAILTLRTLVNDVDGELTSRDSTVERVALAHVAGRLRDRLEGAPAGGPGALGAALDSWAVPNVRIALIDAVARDDPRTLAVLVRDLCAGWTAEGAVGYLLHRGEFELADLTIDELLDEGVTDGPRDSALRTDLASARRRAEDDLQARQTAARLRCDRAGLDEREDLWRAIEGVGARFHLTTARCEEIEVKLDQAIDTRRADLAKDLQAREQEFAPEWAQYVRGLIESEELAAAAVALTDATSRVQLPAAVALPPWSWRSPSLAEVARWFEPDQADAPWRVRMEFVPEPGDAAGRRVIHALASLADSAPHSIDDWLSAVQALVVDTDDLPNVRPKGGGAIAQFTLPYDVRLPRLRWVGAGPTTVTVGNVGERLPLHFSLELTDRHQTGAVVTVSDVLTLLGRDPTGHAASMSSRAMLFLSKVCSQMPFDQVIAPRDTPAEYHEIRRRMLAWLLSILGLAVSPTDLDTLRVLGGGHAVPLWHLIDRARADPVAGINRLRHRDDLDEILIGGLTADLDNDRDLLVLGAVLKLDVRRRAELVDAVELVWVTHGGSGPTLQEFGLDQALDALLDKGYLIENDDVIGTCSCSVVSALRRSDLDARLAQLVRAVDAQLTVRHAVYRHLLDMALHQETADEALQPSHERESRVWRRTTELLSSTTPFDLRELCRDVVSRLDRKHEAVDVLCEAGSGSPIWIAGPGIWVEFMLRELLVNAISAAAEHNPTDFGSVVLEVGPVEQGRVTITVNDDGPGFPEDALIAFQSDQPLQRPERPGRGNGLHYYRRFGEARGARFEIGQRAGGGAWVTVTLPVLPDPSSGI